MQDIPENQEQEQEVFVDTSVDDAIIQDIIQNVENLIETYKTENNIDDIRNISQNEFYAINIYISMSYFKPTKIMYKYIRGVSHNNKVSSMYNDYIVSKICDYYIYLCMRYNKICSVYGFGLFSGISDDVIAEWGRLDKNQRPQATEVYKRLRKTYEKGLENGAQSGKNPVGYIASLNHWFNWSADNKPTLTVNINRDSKQIMSTFDNSLTDNHS